MTEKPAKRAHKCLRCHRRIPFRVEVDGKVRNLSGRRYCLRCVPFGTGYKRLFLNGKPVGEPRHCKLCRTPIPNRIVLNGVTLSLSNRKYCLTCSPRGGKNTQRLELGPAPIRVDAATHARRTGAPPEVRYAALQDRVLRWATNGSSIYRKSSAQMHWIMSRIEDGRWHAPEHREQVEQVLSQVQRWMDGVSARYRMLADDYRFLIDRAIAATRGDGRAESESLSTPAFGHRQ